MLFASESKIFINFADADRNQRPGRDSEGGFA